MSKVCKVGLTISIKYFSYSVLEARKFLGFILIYSSFKALVVLYLSVPIVAQTWALEDFEVVPLAAERQWGVWTKARNFY